MQGAVQSLGRMLSGPMQNPKYPHPQFREFGLQRTDNPKLD